MAVLVFPLPAKAKFSFGLIGHPRSDENFKTNLVFSQIINFLQERQISSVFLAGDLIYGAVEDERLIREEWLAAMRPLQSYSGEVYFVAGNHDLSTPSLKDYYQRYVARLFYSFEKEGVKFIILNSEELALNKVSAKQQLEFLQRNLASLPPDRLAVIVLHRALWIKDLAGGERAKRFAQNADYPKEAYLFWQRKIKPLLKDKKLLIISGDAGNMPLKYLYGQKGGVKYLLTGINDNQLSENIFFIGLIDQQGFKVVPVSVKQGRFKICNGLNPLQRVDIAGLPIWGRLWNGLSARLPISPCTPYLKYFALLITAFITVSILYFAFSRSNKSTANDQEKILAQK